MVGCAFAFCLYQQPQAFQVSALPCRKWIKQLQPLRIRVHDHVNIFSKVLRNPSLSTVYLTCSDPGVMVNSDLAFSPLLMACVAMEADLEISSYDELVHDPINPTSIFSGHPFDFTASANLLIGHAR